MNNELEFLEKIDVIQQRTGLDFASARTLLEEVGWDLLDALTLYEANREEQPFLDRIKEAVRQGNNTKLLIKSNQDTVVQLPVSVGIVGAALAPKLALLGAAACLLSKCSLQLKKLDNPDLD